MTDVKITFGRLLISGIAVGAGLEIGKFVGEVAIRVVSKETLKHVKDGYRRGLADANAKEKSLKIVPDSPSA